MNSRFKNAFLYKLVLGVTFTSLSPAFSSNHENMDSSCSAQIHFQKSEEILTSAPATQWSEKYKISDDPNARKGNQVLHYSSNKHRPYQENQCAVEFVEQYCKDARSFDTDADTLRFASDNAPHEGAIVELGTGGAKTTNFLSALNPKKEIHTFDAYDNGLPEDWDKGVGSRVIPKGTFALQVPGSGYLPPVNNNVYIYVGLFEKNLPLFKEQTLKNTSISLLNVDSDLYSSARTGFDILGNNIVPGTIIHFDELYNYPNYKEGEWKAFQEYIQRAKYNFEVIAFNEVHEQVVIRILSKT